MSRIAPKGRQATVRAAVEAALSRIQDLNLHALRAEWRLHYGTEAPSTFRRELLVRAVAYKVQEKAFGGLSSATKTRLRQIARELKTRGDAAVVPCLRPGTRLIRAWQGKTHHVTVLASGFEWDGNHHRSLSEIARLITGTRWNGLVFFGLKRRAATSKPALPAAAAELAHA